MALAALQVKSSGTWVDCPGDDTNGVKVQVTTAAALDTELPAAAALADNAANPTAPAVGAFGMVWDGATWDRLPGTSAAGAKVQPATGGAGAVDATTQRVAIATDANVVKELRAATATVTSVNDSNVSGTLLASNANRLGATIYNHSDQVVYVKLGTAASTSDFTVVLGAIASSVGGYFEIPFGYTGIVTGVWAADSTGSAKITEITA